MKVTVKDVARQAGVSVGTVSNVLNHKEGEFTQETRERVLQAVRDLKYRPNQVARSLVRRESRAIGVTYIGLGPELSDNAYLVEVLDGVVAAAAAESYNLVLYTRMPPGFEDEHLSHFTDGRIDALCVIGTEEASPLVPMLAAAALPFIVIGVEEPQPGVSWIDVDNRVGATLATERLLRAGHQRVMHFGGVRAQRSARYRAGAFCRTMRRHGLPARLADVEWCDYNRRGGREAAERVLRQPDRPTAIFAADDQVALGVIDAARQMGLRVPEDLSVVGFDDCREAALSAPPLTTVRQPARSIGEEAARWLIHHLQSDRSDTIQCRVQPVLVERATVGPVPDGA